MTKTQQTKSQVFLSLHHIALTELKELGINRVSFGAYVYRACLGRFAGILDELTHMNSHVCSTREAFSSADIAPYLDQAQEI